MWVSQARLTNIRSFVDESIDFSESINVLVGQNNAGKSTILKTVLLMQDTSALPKDSVRLGASQGEIIIQAKGNDILKYLGKGFGRLVIDVGSMKKQIFRQSGSEDFSGIRPEEPHNFIYPYLSRRKVITFEEQINEMNVSAVTGDLQFLYAKIDRLSNPQHKGHREYMSACEDILGFPVTATPSEGGKRATYMAGESGLIPLDSMGDGVVGLLGLIVDLCVAEGKLFLIEEPENDIHPEALKRLMELVIKSSGQNQFIVTTHSNIATKYLGAAPDAKVFSIMMEPKNGLPTSVAEEVVEPHERRKVLQDLGYAFWDYDMWEGWIFLEESSAEKIIRDHLIRWFVPELRGRVRTYAAQGVDAVEPRFEDFNSLFVFLHLEEAYTNRVWVIVDGGDEEGKIISRLRAMYKPKGWNENHFAQFEQHDFERYYPSSLDNEIEEALSTRGSKAKWNAKKRLLEKVEVWIKDNDDVAKKEFEVSAQEVISKLKEIARELGLAGSD